MARGFESKDVEYQQAEAQRPKTTLPERTRREREALERRRTLELSFSRATDDLASATSPAHRLMLERAIESLREQLRQL
jgi:hypothetical protein